MWLRGHLEDAGRTHYSQGRGATDYRQRLHHARIAAECCHHPLSEADDYRHFRSARTGPDGHEIGPPSTGPVPSPPIANPRRWWALSVLCLGLLLIALDTTVLNVALPAIARELHASTSALQWVVDSYTLALGCLQLVFGGLADNLGRRRLLLLGLTVFAAGSIWAAYSLSAGSLIAARALTGYRRSSPIALHPGVGPFSLPRRR
jgi:Major Facilitator Superfamily